jgi:hypothetical protein
MRSKLAYVILVLSLLGVIAGTRAASTHSRGGVRTADIVPWPPHAR